MPSAAHAAEPPLAQITEFILLDLLGAPQPRVRNFYDQTGWLFDEFVSAERRLAEQGLLWESVSGADWNDDRSFFVHRGTPLYGHIEGARHLPSFFFPN
jgi:glutaminyl-peptide cyclotransferase